MKTKIEKYNKLILILLFIGVNGLGFALVTKPYLGDNFLVGWLNVGLLSLLLSASYPLFLLSFYLELKNIPFTKRPSVFTVSIFLVASIVVIANYVFEIIEVNNYPNFVYSAYRIYLPVLQEIAGFQSIVVLLFLLFTVGKKIVFKAHNMGAQTNGAVYVVSILVVVIATHISLQLPAVIASEIKNQIYIKNSNLSFEDTMVDLRLFATQGVFIRDNTPKTAVILHPSQSWEFPELGNQVLLRYYTFPRVLVSPGKIDDFVRDFGGSQCELYSVVAENKDRNVIYPNTKLEYETLAYLTSAGERALMVDGKLTENFFDTNDVVVGIAKHKTCEI